MLHTVKLSIDAMKSPTPVVRLIKPGYETTVAGWRENPLQGLQGTSKREMLIKIGMLASQRSLIPALDDLSWWSDPMPVPAGGRADRDAVANDEHTRDRTYPPGERELLRGLVFAASFNTQVDQFAVCTTRLEQWAFTKVPTPLYLGQQLAKLRGSLRTWIEQELVRQYPDKSKSQIGIEAFNLCKAAIRSRHTKWCQEHERTESFHYLDATIVRVDWFEVLGACETALLEHNLYQQAFCWFRAQGCYRRSSERTPGNRKLDLEKGVADARAGRAAKQKLTLRQQRDLDQVELVVGKLWEVRDRYLDALRAIGHTDRAIMHFRLWTRHAALCGVDQDEPQDEFFGYKKADIKARLEALGNKELPGSVKLADAADRRRPGVTIGRDPVLDELATRLDAARSGDRRLDVQWPEMRALTVEITRQLADARGRKVPGCEPLLPVFEVVVAVGRGGALLATALCQILGVRLMGTMAMSRYADPSTLKGTAPYIRGVELPVVNARRVLVCDDVIKSGATIHTALKVLRTAYPAAELHIAAYLADEAVMRSEEAAGGRDDRAADQWYAGLIRRLRRPDLPHRSSWLNFRWAPIDIRETSTE